VAQKPASASAMEKFEVFFQSLSPAEGKVVSEMVRHALLRAADRYADEDPSERVVPAFVNGLHPAVAPSLVRTLNLPAVIVAYSPGCASRGLLDMATVSKKAD
jgi:hypothetical protein